MADVFDAYALADAWDEMFSAPGQPRSPYQSLFSTLQPLSGADLRVRADQLARVFTDRGVTFAYAGEERPFPLDLVPRIIDAVEWDLLIRAVRQRVRALEAFLADVYGSGRVCLRLGPRARRWRRAQPARGHQRPLLAAGPRHRAAQRGTRACQRRRPRPRRAGPLPRARGQPAHPIRGQLCHREPPGDDADDAGAARPTSSTRCSPG